MEKWLRYFTFFPMDEVRAIVAEHGRDPGKRIAQRRLADEMTERVHGKDALRSVVEASRLLFGGADLRAAGADVLEVLARRDPRPSARPAPSWSAFRCSTRWCAPGWPAPGATPVAASRGRASS